MAKFVVIIIDQIAEMYEAHGPFNSIEDAELYAAEESRLAKHTGIPTVVYTVAPFVEVN